MIWWQIAAGTGLAALAVFGLVLIAVGLNGFRSHDTIRQEMSKPRREE